MLCVSFSVHSTGMSPDDVSLMSIEDLMTKDYNSMFYWKALKRSQYVYNSVYQCYIYNRFPNIAQQWYQMISHLQFLLHISKFLILKLTFPFKATKREHRIWEETPFSSTSIPSCHHLISAHYVPWPPIIGPIKSDH